MNGRLNVMHVEMFFNLISRGEMREEEKRWEKRGEDSIYTSISDTELRS